MKRLFPLLLLVAFSTIAQADGAVQNQYKSIAVEFDNEDAGSIVCNDERENCVIALSIFGKRVSYTQDEIDEVRKLGDIIPDKLEMTRFSEPEGWFHFVYHYWCPKSVYRDNAFSQCYASVTVKQWKISSIRSYGQVDDTFEIE